MPTQDVVGDGMRKRLQRAPAIRLRRPDVDTAELVRLFTELHLTLREIGRMVGMTAQGVSRRLRKAGTKAQAGTWITKPCAYCGIELKRQRSRSHRRENWYCCNEHYYAARSNPQFAKWRHGSRLARAIVSQHYPLSPVEIVHHKDGDERNNDISNLAVYASNSDHMAAHHGRAIEPVWDGATVVR